MFLFQKFWSDSLLWFWNTGLGWRNFWGICWSLEPVSLFFSSLIAQYFDSGFVATNVAVSLFTILWIVLLCWTVTSWNLYWKPVYFSWTIFNVDVIHEHLLFQYVSHAWRFDIENNRSNLMSALCCWSNTVLEIKATWDSGSKIQPAHIM
jgi:hypothetical protein